MDDALIAVGVLLAIFGPLLLLVVVWLAYRFIALRLLRAKAGVDDPDGKLKAAAFTASAVAVGGVVAVSFIPGKVAYERVCAEHETPVISDRVEVDGFMRTRMFPYEARAYLVDGPFRFVEAPDPSREGVTLRYTLAGDGEIIHEEIASPRSRYGVLHETVGRAPGLSLTRKVVFEIEGDRELARAASVVYDGGPLSLFLGAYGMSSCPDVRTPGGSEDFRTFYDLEAIVLGSASAPEDGPEP